MSGPVGTRARDRFGRAVVAGRKPIIAFWTLAAVAATLFLPSIDEAQVGALGDLVPRDAQAIKAEQRSFDLFGFPLISRTVLVQHRAAGLSATAQVRVAARAYGLDRGLFPGLTGIPAAVPLTNAVGRPPLTRGRSTTALTFLFFKPDIGPIGRAGLTRRLEKRYVSRPEDGLVGATGALSARQEQANVINHGLPYVELATVLLVLIAVGLHFRAVGAPFMNMAVVAIAYLVAIRLIAFVGSAVGVSVPREVTPVIVVLLFGVLTDYSIFFLSRFRRLLAEGVARREAAERATAEIAPIVFVAGLSVVAASAALLVARLGFLQAFGPGMALAVLIGLAVALTLTPALMATAGLATFWPTRPGRDVDAAVAAEEVEVPEQQRPARSRALGLATRRPLAVTLVCLLVLGGAATGLARMHVGNPLIRGLPDKNPIERSYRAASLGFTPGVLAPTVIVVDRPGIATELPALVRLQRLLARQPGVAEVAGPASAPFKVELGATISRTGNAARYVVVLRYDPLGARAIDSLNDLKVRMPALLRRAGLAGTRVGIAGDTALVAETVDKTLGDLARVTPVAMVVVMLILAIFLQALVAPLYLVLASALALAASMGLTAIFFIDVLGEPEITYYVPFMAAVLLLALGSDYNVFIVGRIWQEAERRPLRDAVAIAGARAARPITVAGLILGASFGLLAIVDLRSFREIAFAIAAGLVIDAFLVRTLLVPALISLVGDRSGWPGRRLRGPHR